MLRQDIGYHAMTESYDLQYKNSWICIRFFETNCLKEPNSEWMNSDFPLVFQAQHYIKSHVLGYLVRAWRLIYVQDKEKKLITTIKVAIYNTKHFKLCL